MSRRLKRSNARAINEERNYNHYNNKEPKDNVLNIDKFRKPQKKLTLLPKNLAQENYIDALENPNIDIVFAIGNAGTGKAQPLTSKIKIPGGWVTMGDIKVGDIVSTPNGKTSKVLKIFPQGEKETFIIELQDGRTTECCGEHLWEVFYDTNKHPKIMSTNEIIEFRKTHKRPHKIRLIDHEEINDIDLPIHPYVLGVLLGDGSFSAYPRIGFTTNSPEILFKLNELCKEDGEFIKMPSQKLYDFIYRSNSSHKMGKGKLGSFKTNLQTKINELGLFGTKSNSKFIPEIYLHSSKSQKISLLQGLFDTDGYASGNNELQYTTVSKELCDSVIYLIRSIGGTAKVKTSTPTYWYKNEKKYGQLTYNVTICYKNKTELVTLPRKKSRLKDNCQYSKKGTISIKSIRPSGIKSCQCIMIDSPEHLYITDNFIVTHNTYLATLFAIIQLKSGTCDKVVITRPNIAVDDKDIGFLPGNIYQKMSPWTKPVLDVFEEYYSVKDITAMIENNVIEMVPLAYIRGRTFKNAVIILDEGQNTTKNSMLSALTRIGENSKMIITGDTKQSDRGSSNGLTDFVARFEGSNHIAVCHFSKKDVERHPIIEEILKMYGEE